MIKIILRTIFLTLIVCFTALKASSQIGFDYSEYIIGVSAGFNSVNGDALPQKTTSSINLNVGYNSTPYVNFVFEAQLGQLAGGAPTTLSGRQFTGDLTALTLRGQLQLGEIVDYSHNTFNNAIKSLYIGTGAGLVISHITSITRYSTKDPDVYYGGVLNSQEPFLPIRIGYEFKVYNRYQQPAFMVDLAYEYNYVFSDNLDGYVITPKHRDSFTQIAIGVKFAFGGSIVSYRKQIPY